MLRSARRYAPLLVLIAMFLAQLGFAGHAHAQAAITMRARVGYDGAYRLAEWFPVVVDIANDGPDVRATLEWRLPGRLDEQVFQRLVDLPRGSRKRVSLNVYTPGFVRNGQLRLLDGSTELLTQDVKLDAIDESVFLIGVASSDPALLNSLSSVQIGNFTSAHISHLAPADIPDSVASMRGLDAIFLHNIDTAALLPSQREALALWTSLGGQLVVSGGPGGQATAAGLGDLLPVRTVGDLAQGSLAPLAALAENAGATLPASTTLSRAEPQPGAEQLPPGSGLLFRQPYGAGFATFTSFDIAALRAWEGEGALWSNVLRQLAPATPGTGAHLSQFSLLDRGVLKLPSLSLPSPWALLLFILAYVLVLGPLNYIVLRRMGRLELAWITVPVVVLVFTAGLYVVGTLLRGGNAQYNQLAIVESSEGQARGHATSFIGFFSPRRENYTLAFPATTQVSSGPNQQFLNAQFEPVVVDEAGAPSVQLLADISSVTTFVAESLVDLPVQVQSSLTAGANGLSGELRNTGQVALDDAVIVRGDTFARLGTLAPGAAAQIANGSLEPNFPNGLGLSQSGVFDRQSMINLLFDRDMLQFGNPNTPASGPDTNSVYLLGWVSQPVLPANVDGQASEQNSLTLYVVRLNS